MYIDPIQSRVDSNELNHHGVLGMKWGIRRYQPYPKGDKKGKEVGEAANKKTFFQKHREKVRKRREKLRYQAKKTPSYRYTTASFKKDIRLYGEKGVKRILNKVGNKGKTLKQARKSEDVRKMLGFIAGMTGSYINIFGMPFGDKITKAVNSRREAKEAYEKEIASGIINTTGYTMNSDLFLPLKDRR